MQGRWTWVKSSISSLISGSINIGKAVGNVFTNILGSQFLSDAISGASFSSLLSPITIYKKKPDARYALRNYFFENVLCNPAVLVMCEKQLTDYLRTMPGIEGTYAAYGLDVLDIAIYLYMVRRSLNMSVNNMFYSAALAKVATPKPIPIEDLERPAHFHEIKPCPKACGETASTMADIMAMVEREVDKCFCDHPALFIYITLYYLDLSMPYLDEKLPYVNELIPYVGYMLFSPLLSLRLGRDVLNAKLSSVGMCEDHRQEILGANNAYCMGKGASILLSATTIQLGINFATGIKGALLYSNILNLTSNSYMLAELQIDKKSLSNKQPGWDVFKYIHTATRAAVKSLIGDVIANCYDPNSKVTWAEQTQKMYDMYHASPVRLTMKLCFGRDTLVLKEFLKRPAVKSCLDAYEITLKENIEWVNSLRSGPLVRFAAKYAPDRILSQTTKKVLRTLQSKDMDEPAKWVNDLIYRIYPKAYQYIPPKNEIASLERAEAAIKEREEKKEPLSQTAGPLDRALQSEKAREEQQSSPVPVFSLGAPHLRLIGQPPDVRPRLAPADSQLSADTRAFLRGKKD